jgi:ribonuclease I
MRRWLLALAFLSPLSPHAARADTADHYALLMVWMPGLCKLEPDRPECKDLTLKRYDGLSLAFMALQSARPSNVSNTFCFTMPSDSEMDRAKRWCEMDAPRVSDAFTEPLKKLMPIMQSCQDRGLWSKYASCTMYSANDYYSRAIKLATAVAATQLNAKIAGAVGETAKQSVLIEAFTADFGEDWANAVDFVCRKIGKESHLYQVRISLTARALTKGLRPELLWKPSTPLRRSCPETIIVDAPPVPIVGAGKAPAPPPSEPAAPDSAPIDPVESEPLGPAVH